MSTFEQVGRVMARVPEKYHVVAEVTKNRSGETDYRVKAQAQTQDQVRQLRKAIGAKKWTKRHKIDLGWWEYETTLFGVNVEIYACREAPPTCRLVSVEETVIEKVAVAWIEEPVMTRVATDYKEVEVTRTVAKWVCD